MKMDRLRINQLSAETFRWYLSYLRAIDARDFYTYGTFLADTCVMSSNSFPATVGKPAILDRVEQYWQSLAAIEHDLLNIYGVDNCFMLEALNHYIFRDGRAVTARSVALTDRNESGLVKSIRLYTDTNALAA